MQIQPYLFFEGRCEEAIDFYKRTLGAEVVTLMRYKDSPVSGDVCASLPEEKVMHAALRIGDTTVMVSDGRCGGEAKLQGFSLTITAQDDAEVERLFTALADGGQVKMPLAKTFFASSFGMVADRFGVSWMTINPS